MAETDADITNHTKQPQNKTPPEYTAFAFPSPNLYSGFYHATSTNPDVNSTDYKIVVNGESNREERPFLSLLPQKR